MPIKFLCRTCKASLSAPNEKAGVKVTCPKCGQRLQIPAPVSNPAPIPNTVLGELEPAVEDVLPAAVISEPIRPPVVIIPDSPPASTPSSSSVAPASAPSSPNNFWYIVGISGVVAAAVTAFGLLIVVVAGHNTGLMAVGTFLLMTGFVGCLAVGITALVRSSADSAKRWETERVILMQREQQRRAEQARNLALAEAAMHEAKERAARAQEAASRASLESYEAAENARLAALGAQADFEEKMRQRVQELLRQGLCPNCQRPANFIWANANKDGSRDLRYKHNYRRCADCGWTGSQL